MSNQGEKLIGTVSHYYNKIGVAIIDLCNNLSIGDKIKIVGGEKEIVQDVDSMEFEYKSITKASKGDSIGIKVGEKVREGYKVYRS